MITNITIRKEATFDETGCSLNDLKAINIIYGANGSGKTTISRVMVSPDRHSSCSLEWDNDEHYPILVYNRDFCERNFAELNDIAGVYTLGEENVEKQKVLENFKNKIQEAKNILRQKNGALNSISESINNQEDSFQNFCWSSIFQSRTYSKFTHLFDGGKNSKRKLSEIVVSHFKKMGNTDMSFDDLSETYISLFDNEQIIMSAISFNPPKIHLIENNEIWKTPIIGKSDVALSELITKYGIFDWVQKGSRIIADNSLSICPLCQQPITPSIIDQLNELFDERYNDKIEILNILREDYKQKVKEIHSIYNNILKQDGIDIFLDLSKFRSVMTLLLSKSDSNIREIERKIKEPSSVIQLWDCSEYISTIDTLIKVANEKITAHNNSVNNLKIERQRVLDDMWVLIVQQYCKSIEKYLSSIKKLKERKETVENEIQVIKKNLSDFELETQKLNKSMTDIQASIDTINQILKCYNIDNFRLERKDKFKYTIKRPSGEEVKNTLSEGEKTFVTFLYFMQLISGGTSAEKTNEEKIVVIDDPVSSLDSNILYVVSSLIKSLIENVIKQSSVVKQVFVLTHNVFFHHDVSHGSNKKFGFFSFWILNKFNSISHIKSYGEKNPIKSSYNLLWHELKRAAETNMDCGIAQNIMRRIYEHYISFIGPYSNDNLIDMFETDNERKICRALICYINDGSHIIADDLYYIPSEISLQAYLKVFKRLFEVTGNIEHFNMMWDNA